jgi:hypothetical protein
VNVLARAKRRNRVGSAFSGSAATGRSTGEWTVLREDLNGRKPKLLGFEQGVVHAAGDGKVGTEHGETKIPRLEDLG